MKLLLLIFSTLLLLGCTQSPNTQAITTDQSTGAFIVHADDSSLYPDTLHAKPGSTVKILFKVSDQNVYFGGMAFKSSDGQLINTPAVKTGNELLVSFTMPNTDVVYTSYWPANGAKKADGFIRVK